MQTLADLKKQPPLSIASYELIKRQFYFCQYLMDLFPEELQEEVKSSFLEVINVAKKSGVLFYEVLELGILVPGELPYPLNAYPELISQALGYLIEGDENWEGEVEKELRAAMEKYRLSAYQQMLSEISTLKEEPRYGK